MSYQFEFTNHLTNRTEVHKVGHTVTAVQSSGLSGGILGDISEALSTRSGFKFDGKKVWDYLHDQWIRIDSSLAKGRLGYSEGKHPNTISPQDVQPYLLRCWRSFWQQQPEMSQTERAGTRLLYPKWHV